MPELEALSRINESLVNHNVPGNAAPPAAYLSMVPQPDSGAMRATVRAANSSFIETVEQFFVIQLFDETHESPGSLFDFLTI